MLSNHPVIISSMCFINLNRLSGWKFVKVSKRENDNCFDIIYFYSRVFKGSKVQIRVIDGKIKKWENLGKQTEKSSSATFFGTSKTDCRAPISSRQRDGQTLTTTNTHQFKGRINISQAGEKNKKK